MSAEGSAPVSGIVLAGGGSARFGRDKLAEPLDGRPLLAHALGALAGIVVEIVVAGGTAGPVMDLPIPVRHVLDPEADGGPLVGVLAGLEAVREPLALVVAGDMPRLAPAVLHLQVRTLFAADPGDVDAVALVHRDRIQPMPIAVRTGSGTVAARRALGRGSRSVYGWLDGLRVRALDDAVWRPLDPAADTLVDVDRVDDLRRLERPDPG